MILLTDNAAKHIQAYLYEQKHGIGIRLSVNASGCSGFMYNLDIVDVYDDNDVIFESNDVTIVVDNNSLIFVDGITIDYVTEGLNKSFKFDNPNAKFECGCGESFSV